MPYTNNDLFISWLKKEVTPALGCTEPVAIAFAAAKAASFLNEPCLSIYGFISENLYKNAMAVTIPGTTDSGIDMAAAVGIFGGDPDRGLETLKGLDAQHICLARKFVSEGSVCISPKETQSFIHIDLTATSLSEQCRIVIKDSHTNITELYINGKAMLYEHSQNSDEDNPTNLLKFSIEQSFDFINQVPFKDIEFILEAARLNSALSQAGKSENYGLGIGAMLSQAIKENILSNDVMTKILIETVSASDARMGGAPITAMSNFGSGNQGIAATMPVVVVAKEIGVGEEELARALAFSHLVAISIHMRYAKLSGLCAASTASMGSAAAMAWLMTKDLDVINSAIINMISDVSGIICDGASNSCAMKVSTAISCAYRSVLMAKSGIRVSPNDGIVGKTAEQSVNNLCRLVNNAMNTTDKEIIHIMADKDTRINC
ncbi:UPF0597 protein [Serratia marcescens]|nr:UPF0597 protein [Serratia marcescens]